MTLLQTLISISNQEKLLTIYRVKKHNLIFCLFLKIYYKIVIEVIMFISKAMRVFVTLYQEGSLKKAADKLCLTVPPVSK
ncbi:MAG: helix-turn-helix domain-containing protein [Aeromonas popoffii]|uniref:helix-turn-helix domain-containing protein n=1 Tax=Aeromonas popoffii TaxID=70856 RepID=UPI003F2AAA0F